MIGHDPRRSHGLCVRWYLVIVIVTLDLSTLELHAIYPNVQPRHLVNFLNPSEQDHCRITFPNEGGAVVSACLPHQFT